MVIERQDNYTVDKWQGLDLGSTDEFIGDRFLTQADNCYLGIKGELIKRPGTRWVNGISEPGSYDLDTHKVLPLWHFVHGTASSAHKMIFFVRGSGSVRAVLSLDGTGTWATVISNASSPSIAADVPFATQYGNVLYFPESASTVKKWTGSGTASVVASSPSIRQIVAFKDRLWGIGETNTSRIFYTDVPSVGGLPETWNTGTNFIEVGFGDGDQINAIIPIQDRIMIFKNSSIWNLYLAADPADWILRNLTTELGCTSPYAVKMHKNVVYFVNVQGVWSTDGVAFQEITKSLRSLFKRKAEQFNAQALDSISVWNDLLIVSIKNIAAPVGDQSFTIIFRVDQEVQGWTRWKYFGLTDFMPTWVLKQKSASTEGTYWFGGYPSIDGLWALDEATLRDQEDSSTNLNIMMEVTTKAFDIGSISRAKKLSDAYLFATGEIPGVEPTVTYTIDNEHPVPRILTPNDITLPRAYRLFGGLTFRKLQVTIEETSDLDFKIDALHLLVILHRQEPHVR